MQAARKSAEGSDDPDRDEQFRYLADLLERFRAAGEPVISVDAKKTELIGTFATAGPPWRPAWRGRVLESREVVVNLIAGTTTRTGLAIRVELDHGVYEKWIKVADHEMEQPPIVKHKFHGDWNYTIPRSHRKNSNKKVRN